MSKKNNEKKKSSSKKLFERYKILVAARNFHYENFNKWMTYFYVATGAIFLAYITLISTKSNPSIKIEIGILSLGYITGLMLYWSSKGYYYWNINFISLINHYEKHLLGWKKEERIYSVFANTDRQNNYLSPVSGANISTSKIAILFAYIITVAWGTILISSLPKIEDCISISIEFNCCQTVLPTFLSFLASNTITLGLSLIVKERGKRFITSNLSPLDNLNLNQKD